MERVREIHRDHWPLGQERTVRDPGTKEPHGIEHRGWPRQFEGNFSLASPRSYVFTLGVKF